MALEGRDGFQERHCRVVLWPRIERPHFWLSPDDLLKSGWSPGDAPAMIYHSYTPSGPLAEFVERIWHCPDVPSNRPVRILPSGALELVINLREDEIRIYESAQSNRC